MKKIVLVILLILLVLCSCSKAGVDITTDSDSAKGDETLNTSDYNNFIDENRKDSDTRVFHLYSTISHHANQYFRAIKSRFDSLAAKRRRVDLSRSETIRQLHGI